MARLRLSTRQVLDQAVGHGVLSTIQNQWPGARQGLRVQKQGEGSHVRQQGRGERTLCLSRRPRKEKRLANDPHTFFLLFHFLFLEYGPSKPHTSSKFFFFFFLLCGCGACAPITSDTRAIEMRLHNTCQLKPALLSNSQSAVEEMEGCFPG